MRKFALALATASTLGLAAFASAPAQAAATHLGITQTSPAADTVVEDVRCRRGRCWHSRWESRGSWHRRWRSRRWR
jgi:uncharacterized low-complexity protein